MNCECKHVWLKTINEYKFDKTLGLDKFIKIKVCTKCGKIQGSDTNTGHASYVDIDDLNKKEL